MNTSKARTNNGMTPLYAACDEGYGEFVSLLIGAGADTNKARTDVGATPL